MIYYGRKCSGFTCPVEATIQLIGGKYKAIILWHLMHQTLRYSELHKRMPKATDKMLAQQLRNWKKTDSSTGKFILLFRQRQNIPDRSRQDTCPDPGCHV